MLAGYCGVTIAEMPAAGNTSEIWRYWLPSRYVGYTKALLAGEDPVSPYEFRKGLVDWLVELRTDLGALDDLEITCLMYQGYTTTNQVMLRSGWELLPEEFRQTVRMVSAMFVPPGDTPDDILLLPFGEFVQSEKALACERLLEDKQRIPQCLGWSEFYEELRSKGLVRGWDRLGRIEDLNHVTGKDAKTLARAERHLRWSSVHLPAMRWTLRTVSRR
jgi:hypothetical protein